MTALNLSIPPIAEAVNTGRLGTPVAVRVVAHLNASQDSAALDRWAEENATRWLGAAPVRRERMAAASADHRTTLVAFDGGQTALLSTGSAREGSELLQITIFGSHGVLNTSGPAAETWDVLSVPPATPAPPVRQPLKPPYGVLLVAGHDTHQPMYAPAFQADARCRLIGLTDEPQVSSARRARNEQLARELGIPLLPDFDQAVTRQDVQIVSICAEPERRGRLILRAAQAGQHLYLDKPLAGDPRALPQIVAEVRRQGVLAHMFSSLSAPPMARLRGILRSGQLGRLLAVHCDLCFAKGLPGTARLGEPRRETFPPENYELPDAKRELTNVGVYPLTLLTALLGGSARRVAATTGNYFFAEHQARDMEDFGQIVIEWDNGIVATCSAGRTGWQSHAADGLNRVCLIGSDRTVVVDAHWPRVELWSDAGPWHPPERNPQDPMGMWIVPQDSPYRAVPKNAWFTSPALLPTADVGYFLDCLETGRDSQVGAEVAAASSEILLAAYQSAAQGTAIRLTTRH